MSTINSYGTSGSAPKGSITNPYTMEEFESLWNSETWPGGYVTGLGYAIGNAIVISSFLGSGHGNIGGSGQNLFAWLEEDEEEQPIETNPNGNLPSGGNGSSSGGGNSGSGGTTNTNTSTPLKRAQAVINTFERTHFTHVAYSNLSKEKFIKALRDHINNPSLVQQGRNGTCGAAVICKYLAEFHPDKYVKAAISLYRTGYYDEWEWKVADKSKSGTDLQLFEWDPSITSVDAIIQGAIINSYNMILDYDPFTDGAGLRSFMWPLDLKNFFKNKLGLPTSSKINAGYTDLANINYDEFFVIAAIDASNWQDGQSEYTFASQTLFPNHYIQVTGIYDDKGIKFWHWGKDNNHTTNVDTFFIFKIRK